MNTFTLAKFSKNYKAAKAWKRLLRSHATDSTEYAAGREAILQKYSISAVTDLVFVDVDETKKKHDSLLVSCGQGHAEFVMVRDLSYTYTRTIGAIHTLRKFKYLINSMGELSRSSLYAIQHSDNVFSPYLHKLHQMLSEWQAEVDRYIPDCVPLQYEFLHDDPSFFFKQTYGMSLSGISFLFAGNKRLYVDLVHLQRWVASQMYHYK